MGIDLMPLAAVLLAGAVLALILGYGFVALILAIVALLAAVVV